MRKLQQLAIVTMAVGSLSAFGAGVSFADAQGQQAAPQGTQGQQMPQGQQAPQQMQAQPAPQVQGSAPQMQAQGQQAPQGTQISPQLSPTVNLPQAPVPLAAPQSAPQEQTNLNRPYQECSPQTVLQANLPISLLGGESTTQGDTCTQVNHAFNN